MILQALCEYYRRASADPSLQSVPEGYAMAGVSAELVLSADGDLIAVNSLVDLSGKKPIPRQLCVPLPPKRSGQKPEAAFLYETVAFLFGIYKTAEGAGYRFEASREKHETVLKNSEDPGAKALLRFFEKRTQGTVEWSGVDTGVISNPNIFVVFRLQGDSCFLHERSAIRKAWERYRCQSQNDLPMIQCLVTGEMEPLAVLHGNVSGFGTDKPTLVGFNQDSFCSFGMYGKQGANAPVGQKAAFEYVTALNMLCRDPRHCINLAGDKILFWAERDAAEEEDMLAFLMGAAPEKSEGLDEAMAARIRDILSSIKTGGRPDLTAGLSETKFYLLGLSANKTRLVVRFFHCSTFGDLLMRLTDHYELISVVGMKYPWPSPYKLLIEGALNYERDNIQPIQEAALMRSILNGAPYPPSLYQAVIRRVRAEGRITPLRASVLKATINRNENKEVLTVALNRNETDTAYLLGCLFALIERTQTVALGDVNASVSDKYLNSALATPQMVFPVLLTLNMKHLSKIAGEKPGAAVNLRREIGELMDKLSLKPADGGAVVFPDALDTNGQGKFLVGYYHQKQDFFHKGAAVETEE